MAIIGNGEKIEKNFTYGEFMCHCGCGEVKVDYRLPRKLQELRNAFNAIYGYAYIVVEVGYRCPKHNDWLIAEYEAGRFPNKPAKNSKHIYGEASDIKVYGRMNGNMKQVDPRDVAMIAEVIGFGGIGIYDTFNHVDVGTPKRRW